LQLQDPGRSPPPSWAFQKPANRVQSAATLGVGWSAPHGSVRPQPRMAPMAKASPPPLDPEAASSLPAVPLAVRLGPGRPTVYEVGDGGFLVGSVPGCDLRLPGVHLPPVVCLVARHAGGASLRKLAPAQPIQVNGRPVNAAYLDDGDRVQLG